MPQGEKCGWVKGWLWAALLCLTTLHASALTIVPDYAADVPANVRAAFSYATDRWDTDWIASVAASGPGSAADTFTIHVDWDPLKPGVLGQASTPFWTNTSLSYWYTEAQYKVFNNSAAANLGGAITFSSKFNWYTGTDSNVPAGYYDLASVALHEIGHQLGMSDTYSSSADTWGLYDPAVGWRLGYYDSFLRDSSGNAPLAGVAGDAFNETDNPVYFVGANAVDAYGGPVPIYAPTVFRSGSSLSHLDERSPLSGYLMSYSIGAGESVHSLSAVEWGIYQDLGWTMTPEPGTAVFGLLAFGFAVWTRRRGASMGRGGNVA